MGAAAVEHRPRPRGFTLQADTLLKLTELAKASDISATAYVQCLLSMARDVVHGVAIVNEAFGPRLRQLAAQRTHARGWKGTSFNLDDTDMEAIREAREALRLPRQDLVVDYAVQAAWDTKPSGGDGNGGKEDPRDRKRRLARFHNVESSRTRLRSLPLPDQRSLFDEEVSPKS